MRLAAPTHSNVAALRSCLKCVAGMKDAWLYLAVDDGDYHPKEGYRRIEVFVDADWAGHSCTRKSTSSAFMVIEKFLIGVSVQLLATHTQSSGKSEFYAMGVSCADGLYTQAIMRYLGVELQVTIRSDASAASSFSMRRGFSNNMRYVEAKYLFVQCLIKNKMLDAKEVSMLDTLSDLGTKDLAADLLPADLRPSPGGVGLQAPAADGAPGTRFFACHTSREGRWRRDRPTPPALRLPQTKSHKNRTTNNQTYTHTHIKTKSVNLLNKKPSKNKKKRKTPEGNKHTTAQLQNNKQTNDKHETKPQILLLSPLRTPAGSAGLPSGRG